MTSHTKSTNSNDTNWRSELVSFSIIIAIALFIRFFIIELFYVPTASMRETIFNGDYIFSTKYSYGYSNYSLPFSPDIIKGRILAHKPERGDIVILRTPNDKKNRYIKRLIALPGEKIEIKDDVIYVNDQPVERQYVEDIIHEDNKEYKKYEETLSNGRKYYSYILKSDELRPDMLHELQNYGPEIVPENHYFFLGDNRHESGDSRFQLGMIPFDHLIAKARLVIFSTKISLWDSDIGFAEQIKRLGTWICSIRWNRIFQKLYL